MRLILQFILPFALLAAGMFAFLTLKSMAVTPEHRDVAPAPTPVTARAVSYGEHPSVLYATGAVQAAARVDVSPQVSGRVVEVARGLTPGLRLQQGQLIARLDDRDYKAQLVQARAAVTVASSEAQLEDGRGRQATKEWEMLGTQPESVLARREPQAASVAANLESARARVDLAELALERTRITAPFDAIVVAESLEPGQVVAPGAPIATLIGTQRFRVRVNVPVADLALLDVPTTEDGHGSRAMIRQPLSNGEALEREGYVLRLLGELDADSRMAVLLVALDNPFDVPDGTPPILPGAFVDVELHGRNQVRVAAVPRTAVQDGAFVWAVGGDQRLVKREVNIAWSDGAFAYVLTGLAEGEQVITSPLPLPVEGMPLSVTGS